MCLLRRTGPFICDKCGSTLANRNAFTSHNHVYHQSIKLFCDLCPRSFDRKCLIVKHIRRDHLKLRPVECNVCNYKTFAKKYLNNHMLRHGPKTECKICHKMVFLMKNHLETHVKAKCPVCRFVFSKRNLTTHIKTHRGKN